MPKIFMPFIPMWELSYHFINLPPYSPIQCREATVQFFSHLGELGLCRFLCYIISRSQPSWTFVTEVSWSVFKNISWNCITALYLGRLQTALYSQCTFCYYTDISKLVLKLGYPSDPTRFIEDASAHQARNTKKTATARWICYTHSHCNHVFKLVG